jgi:hypothetical protein
MKNRSTHLSMAMIAGLCALGAVPAAHAGSLEPSGPPAPTMKTLDQVPPTWDQILPNATRFQLVLGGAAVLDKETGLVWELAPATTTTSWIGASTACTTKYVGGRGGWRLPSVEELTSLIPISGGPFPPEIGTFWSSTYSHFDSGSNSHDAWFVTNDAQVSFDVINASYRYWCVRGGQGNAIQVPYEATQ